MAPRLLLAAGMVPRPSGAWPPRSAHGDSDARPGTWAALVLSTTMPHPAARTRGPETAAARETASRPGPPAAELERSSWLAVGNSISEGPFLYSCESVAADGR